MKRKQGISLIVLVITIIVIVILAVAVILSIANNNPIGNAKEATFKSDIKTIEEELELLKASNYAKNNGVNYNDPETNAPITISDLTSASGKYQDKLVVSNGELKYKGLTSEERKWAKDLGLTAIPYVLKDGENGVTISEGGTLSVDVDVFNSSLEEIGTDIEIPESVTSIGYGAFDSCPITSINMPNVKYVDSYSFYLCTSLINVTAPKLDGVGENAFYFCKALKNLNLPLSDWFEYGAFSSCTSLETITILGGEFRYESVFYGCNNLREIKILGECNIKEPFWDDLNENCEIKVKYDSVKTLLEEAGCTLNITVDSNLS